MKLRLSTLFTLLVFSNSGNFLYAQWSTIPSFDNVINAYPNQNWTNGFFFCKDGNNGAIYSWIQSESSTGQNHTYINRIDKNGQVKWGSSGIAVFYTVSASQFPMGICEDGSGGCYVAVQDGANGYNVLIQHFDSTGAALWNGSGVQPFIYDQSVGQAEVSMLNTGSGVFVTAGCVRVGGSEGIRAQKISFNGSKQWGEAGSNVKYFSDHRSPVAVSDGNNGYIICWHDWLEHKARMQRLNSSGVRQLDTTGIMLNPVNALSGTIRLISDGNSSFIACWAFSFAGGDGVAAQKFNKNGSKQWGSNELIVCDTVGTQSAPALITDGAGGCFMSWLDGRTLDGFAYIYSQRLNGSGAKQWASMGVKVSTLNAYTHDLAPGANGGVKVGLSVFSDFALYGQLQLISATGTLEAGATGLRVTAPINYLFNNGSMLPLANFETLFFFEANSSQAYAKKDYASQCSIDEPTGLSVTTSCGPNSANLKWEGNLFSTYEVRYKISSASAWTKLGNQGHMNNYLFSGLQPNIQYSFSVRAVCDITNDKTPWATKKKKTQNCRLGDTPEVPVSSAAINVYPNPVDGNATVEYWNAEALPVSFYVMDVRGKVSIEKQDLPVSQPGQMKIEFNTDDLAPGLYIGLIRCGSTTATTKFIVQH